jgi:hypothetical protein
MGYLLNHILPVAGGLLQPKLDELPGNFVHFGFDPIGQGRFHKAVHIFVPGFRQDGGRR